MRNQVYRIIQLCPTCNIIPIDGECLCQESNEKEDALKNRKLSKDEQLKKLMKSEARFGPETTRTKKIEALKKGK